jgi:hypothetical protein
MVGTAQGRLLPILTDSISNGVICGHTFAISQHACSSFTVYFAPSDDQRAQGMPGARCARSRACSVVSTRVSHHGHTGKRPAFPAHGFNGLCSRSPRGPGSFAPVVRGSLRDLNASVGAPGPHDFAVRVRLARQARRRVHRIPLRVRDDRETPL